MKMGPNLIERQCPPLKNGHSRCWARNVKQRSPVQLSTLLRGSIFKEYIENFIDDYRTDC